MPLVDTIIIMGYIDVAAEGSRYSNGLRVSASQSHRHPSPSIVVSCAVHHCVSRTAIGCAQRQLFIFSILCWRPIYERGKI